MAKKNKPTTKKRQPLSDIVAGKTLEPEPKPELQTTPTGTGHAIDYATADWVPIQCPKCGSSNREAFHGRTRHIETAQRVHPKFGHEYNAVIFRPTQCLDCGRKLMTREYRLEHRQELEP
jgi:hypothetical protein